MRITRIHIDHFLGVQHLDLQPRQPVCLIAGPNGSGKSTIREGIRFAFLGEVDRVKLKKEYGALVTEGADSGQVLVDYETAEEKSFAEVTLPKGERVPGPEIDCLPYLLEADRFPSLDEDGRRKALREISGVKASTDEVRRRLEERGCDMERAEEVIPMLRSGFEAAEKAAKDKASEARGAWKQITGEQYGANKAEGWAPDAPGHPGDEAVKEAERRVKALEDQQRKAQDEEQKREAKEKERQDLEARLEQARATVEDLEAAQEEHQAAKQQLEEAEATHRGARQGLASVQNPLACPDCGAALVLEKEGTEPRLVQATGDQDLASAQQWEQQARQALEEAKARYKTASERLAKAEAAAKDVEWVSRQLEEFDSAGGSEVQAPDPEELERAREHYREVWDQAQRAINARSQADSAAVRHKEAQAWETIASALAPDGIPGDLLAEALQPFNDRLRESATATGWAQVHIGADMAITAGGRPYNLLSESERWRAGAMIAESMAFVSGVNLLVLDRLDTLDLPARQEALKWLTGLAGTHETILVMATLKALPEGLPEGVQGVWLEKGRVAEREAA